MSAARGSKLVRIISSTDSSISDKSKSPDEENVKLFTAGLGLETGLSRRLPRRASFDRLEGASSQFIFYPTEDPDYYKIAREVSNYDERKLDLDNQVKLLEELQSESSLKELNEKLKIIISQASRLYGI